ncbi:MAG TPA: hypothetical protein VI758_09910 [Bacteroidota bacterium]
MKMRILALCSLLFITLNARSQTQNAIEFLGGVNWADVGSNPAPENFSAVGGGIGVSMFLSPRFEFRGTAVFDYYMPSGHEYRSLLNSQMIPALQDYSQKQYSADITVGVRMHGQGSEFIHPYLVVDGGMRILSSGGVNTAFAHPGANQQILNLEGTENLYWLGLLNFGVGIQLRPSEALWINFDAKYQFLIGRNPAASSFVPMTLGVQIPV